MIAGSVAAGVSYGGHGPLVLDAFGTTAGFAIDQVHLEGQRETSESAILAALGIGPDSSLLTVDADAARANLVALPWIANATVRKTFPGTVVVKIEEKTPAAIWQHGRQIAVVDDNGDVLSDRLDPRFVDLPLVVGAEANQHLDDILGLLSDFPEIAVQTRAAVFVGSRRWDLVLANGIQVRLPADNARTALAVLIEIDGREDLFTRDVASIDVRLPDRIAILPTDGALERAKEGGSGKGRREASI
ncbi:cell division protein FtsQ/DivIB [Amorphus orientalis]|uniref:Cell division protein FtsQ n=1 Tax=Amorphus orientalis TaxID=649198 RepID=A0AAE3VNV7_9HYPH|nr:cell division protein FtsQ/DivIB [Amorphus orientalis]MDQ0315318.1 cell division protein FtsQ [Amorphus orientalis]